MRRMLVSAVMVGGLLCGSAACGSDEDGSSDDSTVETVDSRVESSVESSVGSSEDTLSTTTGSGVVAPDPDSDLDLDDLGTLQAQVVTDSLAAAETQGMDIDEECYINAVALLSDADAQAVIDAGPDGAADLSEEGEKIRDAASLCILFPDDSEVSETTLGS